MDSHYTSQPSNLTGYKHHSYITSNNNNPGEMDFEHQTGSPVFKGQVDRKMSENVSRQSTVGLVDEDDE